ncbi:MAG: amidohydrolase family protein [Candidatus Cryptobacteroides sp.]
MILFHNATLVTGEREGTGSLLVDGEKIAGLFFRNDDGSADVPYEFGGKLPFDMLPEKFAKRFPDMVTKDLTGKWLMAGGVDAHVHFREPGLTHKADIGTESRAALAGGVTTVMDMPNTSPATVDADTLAGKISLAREKAASNVMFHIGVTNDNASRICRLVKEGDSASGITPGDIAGVKVFMGSSTGNMLVDEEDALDKVFGIKEKPVLVHCEDESVIRKNLQEAKERYGDDIPFAEHEHIRSRRACIKSSIKALELAISHGTRLTLCHISTKEEAQMVRAAKLNNPDICAETSCNYLWFSDEDYERLGSRIKCNPSVKTPEDRQALRDALRDGIIDTIGSDHAPHLESEKEGSYCTAPSGIPSVQFTLPVLLTIAKEEDIPLTRIASVFSEKASEIYSLQRGRLKEGFFADLVVADLEKSFTVRREDIISKCGWSPYEGETLQGMVETVFMNGKEVVKDGKLLV